MPVGQKKNTGTWVVSTIIKYLVYIVLHVNIHSVLCYNRYCSVINEDQLLWPHITKIQK